MTLLVFSILLKVDSLISISWLSVVWPLFLIVIALFLLTLLTLFILLNWFCGRIMRRDQFTEEKTPGKYRT
jgi:hypothetical protein